MMLGLGANKRIGRFAADAPEDEVNPMESVANLSDVMLVLAVALMMAILMHWNVSVRETAAIDESMLEPIDIANGELTAETVDASSNYEKVGTVYRDTETGDLYVIG